MKRIRIDSSEQLVQIACNYYSSRIGFEIRTNTSTIKKYTLAFSVFSGESGTTNEYYILDTKGSNLYCRAKSKQECLNLFYRRYKTRFKMYIFSENIDKLKWLAND